VNRRRVAAFIDAVVADRRPRRFRAASADTKTLRAAIALRTARPGEGAPEESFVAALHRELAQQIAGPQERRPRAAFPARARLYLGAAAVATLVGGTAAAMTAVDHLLVAAKTRPPSASAFLRMGTFETGAGRKVGQIVAYRGSPSWVFMSIHDPSVSGTLACEVKASDGRTVATGSFVTHDGSGEWARTLLIDVGRVRNAILVTPGGATVANARLGAV
jgi:hypothetical protein